MARCAEDAATYERVIDRDGGMCIECGRQASAVHEVLARSHFGRKGRATLFDMRNRCCLCSACHTPMAHTRPGRTRLLRRMAALYHYDYSDLPFSGYL